jgi:putative ABC transport system permease protein
VRWQDTDHLSIRQEASACRHVLPEFGRGGMPVRSRYNNGSLLVTGSLPAFASIRSLAVAEGRFYNDADDAAVRRVAFIGSDVRKQLFSGKPAIGETIHIADLPYTVIGVMQEKGQNSSYDGKDVSKVFIPFHSMMRDFPQKPPSTPHDIDRLLVAPASWEEHEQCKFQVRRALGRLHGFDPNDKEAAMIWDTVENAKAFVKIIDGMQYFLGAVGVATLFLGGIGVMNVMLVAVRERTLEIGVRKAVGATAGAIRRQFFTEALLIALLSGSLGLAAGLGLCLLVNQLKMPGFFAGMLVSWQTALASAGLLGAVAVLSAVYPASRAATVDPIEALRWEAGG